MSVEKPAGPWTVLRVLSWTQSYFETLAIDSPRLAAELLLARCLGMSRLELYLQFDRPMTPSELSGYRAMVARRARREPVAYITGTRGFWDLEFSVSPHVLIPRPDTETLVETALEYLDAWQGDRPPRVLELGVGSGAVILSLAHALADRGMEWYATDLSPAALGVARANHRSQPGMPPVHFLAESWFSAFGDGAVFDLILSNPPYIPSGDIGGLEPEIHFEPRLALDGGPDGLTCFREILARGDGHLTPGGVLMLEMGYDQRQGLRQLAAALVHYGEPRFVRDSAGHDRVAVIKKKIANPGLL